MDAEFGMPQWVFGMTTYGFRAAATFDVPSFEAEIKGQLRHTACGAANLRAVLEAKGRVRYTYRDRQGEQVASIELDLAACRAPTSEPAPADGPVG